MKSILICPGERPDVPLLSAEAPLAIASALGHGLVDYWMSHLACAGVKQVLLIAGDRPEQVRKAVGTGSRWGLDVDVKETPSEPLPEMDSAIVMDHFPGLPEYPLFGGYQQWFKALEAWMPRAKTPDRVGVREVQAGIWVGLHGHISREARLHAPCWIGDHVYVGAGATIGPSTVLENGAFVEAKAEVKNSVIGPATFVGQYFQIDHSLVWGNTQLDWQTGHATQVTDEFLLSSLHPKRPANRSHPWLDRLAEWLYRLKEDQQPMEPQAIPITIKRGS